MPKPYEQRPLSNLPNGEAPTASATDLHAGDSSKDNANNDSIMPYLSHSFFSPMAEHKKHLTQCEIEGLDNAILLLAHIGWSSDSLFKEVVSSGQINNFAITLLLSTFLHYNGD